MKTIRTLIVFVLFIASAFAGEEYRVGTLDPSTDLSAWRVCAPKELILNKNNDYVSYRHMSWAGHYLADDDLKRVFLLGDTVKVMERGQTLTVGPNSKEPVFPNEFFRGVGLASTFFFLLCLTSLGFYRWTRDRSWVDNPQSDRTIKADGHFNRLTLSRRHSCR